MVAASALVKSLYLTLFCETCVAHLLHNCAIMKVTSHLEDGDQLIKKVKSTTVKRKTRQTKFATTGCSPQPGISRWGSWLNDALQNAKKSPKVKTNVKSFK